MPVVRNEDMNRRRSRSRSSIRSRSRSRGLRGRRSLTTSFAGLSLRRLNRLASPEHKLFETYFVQGVTSTTAVIALNLLAQGTTNNTRIGDQVTPISLEMNYNMSLVYSSVTNTNLPVVRVMILRDAENQGADPANADIFEAPTHSFISPIADVNRRRFKVLYDKYDNVGYSTIPAATTTYYSVVASARISLRGVMRFRASAAASASLAEGALYFVCVSNLATLGAGANDPKIECITHLKYTDS